MGLRILAFSAVMALAIALIPRPAIADDTAIHLAPRERLYAEATALWHEKSCRDAAPLLMRLRRGNPYDAIGVEATRLLAICAGDGAITRNAFLLAGYDSDLAGAGARVTIAPEDGSSLGLLIESLRAAHPDAAIPDTITIGAKATPGIWAGMRGGVARAKHHGGGRFGSLGIEGDARLASRTGHGRLGLRVVGLARSHTETGGVRRSGFTLSTRYAMRGKDLDDLRSHSLTLERHGYLPAKRGFTAGAGGRVILNETHGNGRSHLNRGEVVFSLVHDPAAIHAASIAKRFELAIGESAGNDGYGDGAITRLGMAFGPFGPGEAAINIGGVAERTDYARPRPWSRTAPRQTRYGLHAALTHALGQGRKLHITLRAVESKSDDRPDSGRKISLEAEFPL